MDFAMIQIAVFPLQKLAKYHQYIFKLAPALRHLFHDTLLLIERFNPHMSRRPAEISHTIYRHNWCIVVLMHVCQYSFRLKQQIFSAYRGIYFVSVSSRYIMQSRTTSKGGMIEEQNWQILMFAFEQNCGE